MLILPTNVELVDHPCGSHLTRAGRSTQRVTMGRDKAGHLFVDKAGAVQFKEVRCLEREVELEERAGHVNVWCDPGEGPGHKSCACIDHRLTLPQPSRSKPAMFLQQINGEEGSALGQQVGLLAVTGRAWFIEGLLSGTATLIAYGAFACSQDLEDWRMKARNTFKGLAEDSDLIYVYISARPLSAEGLKYILSKRDLLVVPRQTLGAYLPVIYDRLVIGGRALDALVVPA